jgi:chromate transport protein ChrA
LFCFMFALNSSRMEEDWEKWMENMAKIHKCSSFYFLWNLVIYKNGHKAVFASLSAYVTINVLALFIIQISKYHFPNLLSIFIVLFCGWSICSNSQKWENNHQ